MLYTLNMHLVVLVVSPTDLTGFMFRFRRHYVILKLLTFVGLLDLFLQSFGATVNCFGEMDVIDCKTKHR